MKPIRATSTWISSRLRKFLICCFSTPSIEYAGPVSQGSFCLTVKSWAGALDGYRALVGTRYELCLLRIQ